MEYRIYEDSYNRFSPVMQDLFKDLVKQAVEVVNSMNGDIDVFEDLYTPRTILDQTIDLLKMEMDPTDDGMFRVTDLMENAMKFTIMEYLKYEVSEDERYRDSFELDLDDILDVSDR